MDYHHFFYNEFPDLIANVKADTPALWGKMNAQQMVEHLAYVVGYSNGRFEATPNAEPERLAYRKMRFFEKFVPFPQSVRVDFVPEEPIPPQYADIEEAKAFLFAQLQRFDDYHAEHPGIAPAHVSFGPLVYEEWIQMHARHFRHHLEQFGVLERSAV